MKRYIWSGHFAALVLVAAVGVTAQSSSTSQKPAEPTSQLPTTAQEPASQPAPQQPTTASEPAASAPQSHEGRITVAGCLQAAPSAPVATSGSAPAPPATTDKAEKPSDEGKLVLTNAVSSAAEPAASASGAAAPVTYRLIANEAALSPHIGKKLELSGTIEASSPAASASNGPMLRVEAGKVVAESCTQ